MRSGMGGAERALRAEVIEAVSRQLHQRTQTGAGVGLGIECLDHAVRADLLPVCYGSDYLRDLVPV